MRSTPRLGTRRVLALFAAALFAATAGARPPAGAPDAAVRAEVARAPSPDALAAAQLDELDGDLTVLDPVPVVVWNREVVVVRAGLGTVTPEGRAKEIRARLTGVPDVALGGEVSVEIRMLGPIRAANFSLGERFLFSVFESDLDPLAEESFEESVEATRVRVADLFRAQAEQRSLPLLVRGIGITAGACVGLFLALLLLGFVKRTSIRRFRTRAARSERLRIRNVDLRPYVADAFERIVGIVNLVAIAATLYVWLELVLRQFPYTAPWGEALDAYLSDLLQSIFQAVARAVPDLVIVALIFFATRGLARTVTQIVVRLERRAERTEGVAPESVRATRRVAVALIWILGVVLAYPHIPGSQSDAFKGISVLLGLMVSLGSAGLVNQVMSGFVVLYSRAVRSGEVVRIGDVEGQVTDLGLLSTKVLVPSGEEVSIPNAVVITQATTNYSRVVGGGRAVATTTVTIGYDVPWRQVRALLLLASERTEGIVRDPGPRVSQRELGDWYVEYVLVLQVEDGKQRAAVLSRLHSAIQDAFNEFGVQIMSPHFVSQPDEHVVVPRGEEEPDPAPRFRFAKESPPASFDPVAKAAQERVAREAEEAAKAERRRLREERGAAASAPGNAKPDAKPDADIDAEVDGEAKG